MLLVFPSPSVQLDQDLHDVLDKLEDTDPTRLVSGNISFENVL